MDTVREFRQKGLWVFEHASHDHIVNCDETYWNVSYFSLSTWAKRNSDNITIDPNVDPKKGFTALASILKNGKTLPLIFIARGKTLEVERNWFGDGRHVEQDGPLDVDLLDNPLFGHYAGHLGSQPQIKPTSFTDHSPNGWTNDQTFMHYLKFLRKNIPYKHAINLHHEEDKIYLFADSFGAHHSNAVKQFAESLNIEIIKIPPGTTDMCQPLDCRIFGALKAQARAFSNGKIAKYVMDQYDRLMSDEPRLDLTPYLGSSVKESSLVLDIFWRNVRVEQVLEAWDLAFGLARDGPY